MDAMTLVKTPLLHSITMAGLLRSTSQNQTPLYGIVLDNLDSDYNPVFQNSEQYDDGVEPTIRFTSSKNSSTLLEVHKSQSTGQHWDWNLTLNQTSGEISWGAHGQTSTPLHDKDRDSAVHWIEVLTEQHQNAGSDTLLYETRFDKERIRYPQIAFVEYQNNNAQKSLMEMHGLQPSVLAQSLH